jgi:glycosyltransferase involved in cell wall biosynthesis
LSIITVNKNNAAGLEKTIQSVICQTFVDFEFIVIDGVSNDNSVEIIKKYSEKIYFWVSEPDNGIYNAMNKGIRKAQGEYCLFLNSGDCLVSSSTLESVFNEINSISPADIYYSDRVNSDGKIWHFPKKLTISYLVSHPISHQNSLIKRSLFIEHGYYNENLNIASDWEFFLKESWKYKTSFYYIETNISVFDIHGIGSQDTPEHLAEKSKVFQNVFNELSDILMEIHNYHKTTYYNIIKNYGNTNFLTFLLRSYKLLMIIINKITCLLKNNT